MAELQQTLTLGELSDALGGECIGDAGFVIRGVKPLAVAGADDLSFVTNPKYVAAAKTTQAGALLIAKDSGLESAGLNAGLIVVDDPHLALARVLELGFPESNRETGVHPTAIVGKGCTMGADTSVGPYCVVGDDVVLGDRVRLGARVNVGDGCVLGADSAIYPGVVLYDRVVMGQRCVVHSGAVIGSDGFGYASATGLPTKIRQVGRVVLGDDVEVGANSAIDRAMLEETVIGSGTKIDNLVQVGHNVVVGEGCLLCGQAGIAGSAVLGDRVVLAGQAGVSGHLEVGSGVQVAAKSAVLQTTTPGSIVAGIPARPIRDWQRQDVATKRLPELMRRVRQLERAQEVKDVDSDQDADSG